MNSLLVQILISTLLGSALGKEAAKAWPPLPAGSRSAQVKRLFSPARKPQAVLPVQRRPQQLLQRTGDHLRGGGALQLPGAQAPAWPGAEQAVWKP